MKIFRYKGYEAHIIGGKNYQGLYRCLSVYDKQDSRINTIQLCADTMAGLYEMIKGCINSYKGNK